MADRKNALAELAVGDIFHAESPNGASLICLVTSLTEAAIQARTVTTQENLSFDRQTGIAIWGDKSVPCSIDSIASLPAEIHDIVLHLDHKFRFVKEPEQLKLTAVEKQALLYIDKHYCSHPLYPPPR